MGKGVLLAEREHPRTSPLRSAAPTASTRGLRWIASEQPTTRVQGDDMTRFARTVVLATCGAAAAGLLVGVPAGATPLAAPLSGNADFSGIVRLSNCSGSIVRWGTSRPSDP